MGYITSCIPPTKKLEKRLRIAREGNIISQYIDQAWIEYEASEFTLASPVVYHKPLPTHELDPTSEKPLDREIRVGEGKLYMARYLPQGLRWLCEDLVKVTPKKSSKEKPKKSSKTRRRRTSKSKSSKED